MGQWGRNIDIDLAWLPLTKTRTMDSEQHFSHLFVDTKHYILYGYTRGCHILSRWTLYDVYLESVLPGPCLTTAIWRCRKNSSQWQRSCQWKLHSHWLKLLRQRQVAVVIQDPVAIIGRVRESSTCVTLGGVSTGSRRSDASLLVPNGTSACGNWTKKIWLSTKLRGFGSVVGKLENEEVVVERSWPNSKKSRNVRRHEYSPVSWEYKCSYCAASCVCNESSGFLCEITIHLKVLFKVCRCMKEDKIVSPINWIAVWHEAVASQSKGVDMKGVLHPMNDVHIWQVSLQPRCRNIYYHDIQNTRLLIPLNSGITKKT